MSAKDELIYAMSGSVMDALVTANEKQDLETPDLDTMSQDVATTIYNELLPPYRAILTDRDGNVIGSVDLHGASEIVHMSESKWYTFMKQIFHLGV
jgi:hypothetical protein